jgi:hypothetical protein
MMNIIENLINGNISIAKMKAKNRSFMWLIAQGESMGLDPLQRWNAASFLKGMTSYEEYCKWGFSYVPENKDDHAYDCSPDYALPIQHAYKHR